MSKKHVFVIEIQIISLEHVQKACFVFIKIQIISLDCMQTLCFLMALAYGLLKNDFAYGLMKKPKIPNENI